MTRYTWQMFAAVTCLLSATVVGQLPTEVPNFEKIVVKSFADVGRAILIGRVESGGTLDVSANCRRYQLSISTSIKPFKHREHYVIPLQVIEYPAFQEPMLRVNARYVFILDAALSMNGEVVKLLAAEEIRGDEDTRVAKLCALEKETAKYAHSGAITIMLRSGRPFAALRSHEKDGVPSLIGTIFESQESIDSAVAAGQNIILAHGKKLLNPVDRGSDCLCVPLSLLNGSEPPLGLLIANRHLYDEWVNGLRDVAPEERSQAAFVAPGVYYVLVFRPGSWTELAASPIAVPGPDHRTISIMKSIIEEAKSRRAKSG